MREFEIKTKVVEMSPDELSPEFRTLVDRAKEMTYKSYAPYSKFCVGAAILLADGEIVTGANQENVAYPSGTCAERSACYYAHANHPDQRFVAIAIAARDTSGEFVLDPVAPCGACRQALLEYEAWGKKPVKVILVARDKVFVVESVSALLPLAFVEFS